jgi:hypothetical protein
MDTEVASLSSIFPWVNQDSGVAMTTEQGEHIYDYLGDN